MNSIIYNSEDHEITLTAKKLVEAIKRQIRGQLNLLENQDKDEESKKHSKHQISAQATVDHQLEDAGAFKITINNPNPSFQTDSKHDINNSKKRRGRPAKKNGESDDDQMDSDSPPQHDKGQKRVVYQEEVKLATDAISNQCFPNNHGSTGSKDGRRSTRQNARKATEPAVDSSTKITISLGSRTRQQPP